jgi:catechol 2,3-dioxygenase-like lactoylglutathione lyase family enzyme
MRYVFLSLALLLSWNAIHPAIGSRPDETNSKTAIQNAKLALGNFSVSLTVKDISASKSFYEKLGFEIIAGDVKQRYLILQNNTATIGLFQGMFDKNSLTFNPGWDRNSKVLAEFQDVRELQQELKRRGVNPVLAVDESTTGPGFFTLVDPDGNPILIDQHVPKPARK